MWKKHENTCYRYVMKLGTSFLILILAILLLVSLAFSTSLPKDVIRNLPEIRCTDDMCSDRSSEEITMGTLETLGEQHLKLGMSSADAEKLFGRPRKPNGSEDSWKDVRCSNPVLLWIYAYSISGTSAYVLIFVHDKLDYFGMHMLSMLLRQYGDRKSV